MIKPPARLTFDFDENMSRVEYHNLTNLYKGTKHEYVRRDLVEKAMRRIEEIALWKGEKKFNGFAQGLDKISQKDLITILNQIISEEENKK